MPQNITVAFEQYVAYQQYACDVMTNITDGKQIFIYIPKKTIQNGNIGIFDYLITTL